MKLRKSVVMRRTLHPNIIDPNFFAGLKVVIHNHPACSHDSHFTDFSRLEPAALDRGKTFMPEIQRHISYVFDARGDMRVALTVISDPKLTENMKNNRN